MPDRDREKVTKAIKYLNWYFSQDDGAADKDAVDAWEELTKEQEPVKPIKKLGIVEPFKCGACEWVLGWETGFPLFCPRCGKEVKWDVR